MSDKKITDSASKGGESSDVSDDIADLLANFSAPKSEVAPNQIGQTQGGGSLGKRKHYRHPVRWRVAIVNKGNGKNDIYHGRTYDVSLSGISILLDHNIFFTSEVVVLLAIPPMHQGLKETIVEIQSVLTHYVLDSVHSQFRLGMRFLHFKGDGHKILSDVLAKRHIPKQDPNPYVSTRS
jgi:hypothetical protein